MDEPPKERFERIRQAHGAALGRVVASYARPGADQDDLGQDIALALWHSLPRFRGECSEKTFVLRVAHHRGIKYALRKQPVPMDTLEPVDPQPAPDQVASRRQQMEGLFGQVRKLQLPQREVLALALEDLSHEEIGAALGLSPGNVAVRLSRARAALRELMSEVKHE